MDTYQHTTLDRPKTRAELVRIYKRQCLDWDAIDLFSYMPTELMEQTVNANEIYIKRVTETEDE